jgi:hypothetical protein
MKYSDVKNKQFYLETENGAKKVTVIDLEDTGYTCSWYQFKVQHKDGKTSWENWVFKDKGCKIMIGANDF